MSLTHERARVAALSRERDANDPVLLDAKRELRSKKLLTFVEKTVAEFPPLTDEQIHAVAAALGVGERTK